jgi:uncharacterized protein YbcI
MRMTDPRASEGPDVAAPALGGSQRTALENAVVGVFKQYFGRGPTAAKAWLLDDYVLVVLEEGLTRSEETLVADGKEDEVRRFRLTFEQTVAEEAMSAVSRVIGRNVISYHSQIVFHPTRSFEIFVLEPETPN